MFLRSLTLKGFKSFADKTTLEFAPGVSVIVGPNGSGKSNLVDAISWVLGEQGVRSLRGGQMADVIFAGTPKRSALGMAEVQLVIDNEAGKIPVPMSELQISRGVFRSGDSEYRIGGELRRLMDIQELLSDSGIGRALHTIVGQGQLDEVLTARPEDRRQFIEEAAGIAKHRRRKERAQRKLGSLEQDLLRLQDVLTELRRQLKPLRQQAEMATKHEKLSSQADDVAWRLAAARLRGLLQTRDGRRPVWEEGLARRAEAKARLEELDGQIDDVTQQREAAAAELVRAEEALRMAQEDKTRADVEHRAASEREAEAKAKLASESARSLKLASLRDEVKRAQDELGAIAGDLEAREIELTEAEQAFRTAEAQRREVEEERRRLSEEAAAHRAEMETLRRSLASYERERERVAESLGLVTERVAQLAGEREAVERTIESLDATFSPASERRDALQAERERLTTQAGELQEGLRAHRSRVEVLDARRADLAQTPGRRFLEAKPDRSAGLLRDLIRIDRGYEAAVFAALGPYADAVVYDHEERALADAPDARGALLTVPTEHPGPHALSDEEPLASKVRADQRAGGIVAALLRDVYLADDVQDAARKRRAHPGSSFVTGSGILVGEVAITTASEDGVRARELGDAHELALREVAAAESALRPVRRRVEDLAEETGSLTAELARTDAEITAAAESMARLDSELAASRKEHELLEQRLAGMDEGAAVWRDALAAPAPQHEMPALPPAPEAPVSQRVAVETARASRASIEGRVERLREELDSLAAQTPELLRATADSAEAQRVEAEAARSLADETHAAALRARQEAATSEREATTSETEINRRWREAAAALDHLRETYEEEDRARGDLDRRIAEAERLLSEGHQKDPNEAVEALDAEDTVASLERTSELVARRLGLLGRVNLLATGEFDALQERHDFLERELDDVKKARRDLLEVVRRVDDEVVQLFDAAFRDVAGEFEKMFKELFPGGEGRLVLTDPANLLETGIEVEARPGRKRVKRLSLLSGGERALTALGFLFSIFRARPSPFYLLDEVEAALDDVNLHRFLGLIKEFAKHSQVIIVTHQKRTMEVAEMMYGVSMDKDGSSRVVCQRLEDPSEIPDSPADLSGADAVH